MRLVSEIISVVLILIISLSLVSLIIMYGYPMITKAQDKGALERIITLFSPEYTNSIVKKMEQVSKFGGSTTINLEIRGAWEVVGFNAESEMNNSLSYTFISKVTNVNSNRYISLSKGESCPPGDGIIGINSPFVVCFKGEPSSTGFIIKYTIFARNLTSDDQTYVVRLKPKTGDTARSTSTSIRIERTNLESFYEDGKKIIIATLEVIL
ncbi:MAG: hypothetical protein QXX30_01250 [Candidatus Aenigmatarchaeota archaeon]